MGQRMGERKTLIDKRGTLNDTEGQLSAANSH